jgi:putative DNA primase/helicase
VEQPGCKADHVLTLEGPQGMLKSSALQALAEPWFTDRISHLGGKDAAMEISGIRLVELAELDALLRATLSTIKAFVSRCHDGFDRRMQSTWCIGRGNAYWRVPLTRSAAI